ncbi:MAG: ROK family transcriptional regulator [Pseudomonadales bacterium]|nr:ROK family transcriptional regulator [Pseudomonadales bacterium]NRA13918.1 ROK family transcriptional regulator [Oceanospirillaceae bacterium]
MNQKPLAAGANQSKLREYNERAILSLIRKHGSIAKANLAKLMGLSAQSMSVIMRGLEQEGLLLKGKAQKGNVGQPSIPMRLNPDGVFTIGLKIGRRRAELILMDFVGEQRAVKYLTYRYPTTHGILSFVADNLTALLLCLSKEQRKRIIGLGVAMPFELWNWAETMGATQQNVDSWHQINIETELNKLCNYPITIQNDATAACAAELVFGRGTELPNFSYIFIGFFIGGGVVLNHSVYSGSQGNAGAYGSMPVIGPDGKTSQLINHASIALLEKQLDQAAVPTDFLWQGLDDWSQYDEYTQRWVNYIAKYIAFAVVSSCSVIDFSHIVIDGAFPSSVRKKVVIALQRELLQQNLQGILEPSIKEALLEHDPRVIGSACLPLFKRYLLDQNLLYTM